MIAIEWMAENWLTLTGWVIGLVSIIVAVVFYLRQRNPKRLDYQVVNSTPLLADRTNGLGDDLVVSHRGKKVADPHILTIRIINSGKQSVQAAEYDRPVTIAFRNAFHLASRVVDSSSGHVRPDLAVQLHLQDEAVVIETRPRLLNRGEWFNVQIVSDGAPQDLHVHSRFPDQAANMRELDASPTTASFITVSNLSAPFLLSPSSSIIQSVLRRFLK
jgi:hypothetical protein